MVPRGRCPSAGPLWWAMNSRRRKTWSTPIQLRRPWSRHRESTTLLSPGNFPGLSCPEEVQDFFTVRLTTTDCFQRAHRRASSGTFLFEYRWTRHVMNSPCGRFLFTARINMHAGLPCFSSISSGEKNLHREGTRQVTGGRAVYHARQKVERNANFFMHTLSIGKTLVTLLWTGKYAKITVCYRNGKKETTWCFLCYPTHVKGKHVLSVWS